MIPYGLEKIPNKFNLVHPTLVCCTITPPWEKEQFKEVVISLKLPKIFMINGWKF